MRRSLPLLAIPAALLVVVAPAASAAQAADPPSIAQLCLATGIEEVDALLDGVATSDLAGVLSPLAELTVPDRSTVELDAAVQLSAVRKALNCDGSAPITTTPAPTTTPTRAPSTGSGGFSQLDRVPSGAAETGGGPAA